MRRPHRSRGIPALGVRSLLAIAACSLSGALAPPSSAATIDFLHIEANEGGSSGGHVALRLDDAVWHFQNADGLLLLTRDDATRFVREYALIQNRPIHVSRIALPDAAERAVRERFQARLDAQRSQQDALAAARFERGLLAWLRGRARGRGDEAAQGPAIPGAGYFDRSEDAAAGAPALAALRELVLAREGRDFFARRGAALHARAAALAPRPEPSALPTLDVDLPLPYDAGFGARYADLAAEIVALDVLERARPLRPGALRVGDAAALPLAPEERRALRAFLEQERDAALRLVGGSRPDRGAALLVTLARIAALDASLRADRLVVLDAYPDDAPVAPSRIVDHGRALLPRVAEETASVAREALKRFAAHPTSQAAWSDVEDAANRHHEVVGVWRSGRPLRAGPERLVPLRAAQLLVPVAPPPPVATLDEAYGLAARRERRLDAEMRRLRGYDLIQHNCVSALFDTLNASFASPALVASALGGSVDGRSGLGFIPFVSADQVRSRLRVTRAFTIPSLRRARLARIRPDGSPLWLALRESSPVTARLARPGARDSFFLFFTDDAVWPRPILGVANLAAAVGQTGLGLLGAPLDRGRTLVRGLSGVVMSLPELVFVNLRKGTTDWVPRDTWRELGVELAAPAPPTSAPAPDVVRSG